MIDYFLLLKFHLSLNQYLKPLDQPVVFSEKDCVHGSQPRLLADPRISTVEAESRMRLTLVVLVGLGQEVLSSSVRGKGAVQAAINVFAQLVCVADVVAVDHARVDEPGVLVYLLAGA
jgi:hypothetical protein